MSLDIKHIIIHRINKEKNSTNNATLKFAGDLLPIENCIELITKLNNTFNTGTSKQYGSFNEDTTSYPFSNLLKNYIVDDNDNKFIEFTKNSMELLKNRINTEPLATGGDILFVRYKYQNNDYINDYIIVMMLKIKKSFSITEKLKLEPVTHINDDEIEAITRINLTLWNTSDEEKYISFTKKGKSGDISIYFTNFIGCTEFTKSKEMTKELVEVIKKYVKKTTPIDKVDQKNENIFRFIKDMQKNNKEIDLIKIDCHIDPTGNKEFIKYLNDNNIFLSNNFPADLNLLNKLNRFTYKLDGFNISFDKDFSKEKILFDSDKNILQIKYLGNDFKEKFKDFINE